MKTVLQSLLLVCLLTPCQYLSAQTPNPYNLELKQVASRLASAGELQDLVLLDQIFGLRGLVDDRGQILNILERVAGNPSHPDLVRQEAKALVNQLRTQAASSSAPERWYKIDAKRAQILAQAGQLSHDGSAEHYELLAELQYMAGEPAAAETMEHAAQLIPTAYRWLRAALFTTDPFRKFANLQAGLALAPADIELNLQLAAHYVGRNQLEKARDLLTRAAAASPRHFVVGEHLAALYLNLGLRADALRQLNALQQEWPGPLWLKSRLALDYEQLGLREQAARFAASVLAQQNDDRVLLELLARFHEARHMSAALKEDYLALSNLEPQTPQLWTKLARLQIDSGDLDAARASLLRALGIDNSQLEVHRLLADVYQRLHLEAEARQELAVAASNLTVSTSGDAEFLADPAALARQAFLHPPKAPDLVLADIRIQELYSSGLDRVHVQQLYFVGSDAAVEDHRLISVQYSPSSQALRMLHARIWKPNGERLDAQDLGDRQPGDSPASIYYDLRTRQLRFSGLDRGDVVEIEYSLSPVLTSSPYGSYFGELVFFANRQATRLKRYVLIAPATQTVYAHAEKLSPEIVLARDDSKIFVWESQDVPGFVRERRSPGISEVAPYVHVSTFADWQQLGAWYADLVRPQFALDSTLEEEVARLLQGKGNDREKIAAIQDFVLRGTHYVAQEFGVYSYKPYPVAQTYARRFGDCKDKASLMIALLRAAGIEAQIALVRTRSMGAVVPQPASMAVFDHAIVYIPKYDLWLDGTAEYAVRELPLEDQDALALTVALNGKAQLRHTPMSRATDNYTKHTIQAELTSKGMIRFSGSTAARGEDAPGLREELSVREQQLDSLRRDLAQVFPSVQVYSVNVRDEKWMNEEAPEGEISVEFQGDLDSLRQKRIVSLSSSWIPRAYTSALAPSETRTADLMLFAPWVTEEEIRIALPAGARIAEVPRDKNISTPFGSLKLHYKKQSEAILVQSRVQFDNSRVEAADYPAFRHFCVQIERSFGEGIRVELPQ